MYHQPNPVKMKKLILLFSLSLLLPNLANAQWWNPSKKVSGNGELTTQKRTVGEFDEVAVTGMMDVQLIEGKEGSLTIEAESNLMEYLETEVENGRLKISVKNGVNLQPSRNRGIKVTVPVEQIYAVDLTGSGNVTSTKRLKSSNFKVDLTGSGDIDLDLETENLEGRLTGSGDVKLKGKVREFSAKVTGSGDFLASNLTAEEVDAAVLGSGDIQVRVTNSLRARVSGSGDIYYYGNPEKEDFKTTGSGSISKR